MHLIAWITAATALSLAGGQTRETAGSNGQTRPAVESGNKNQEFEVTDSPAETQPTQTATGFLYRTIDFAGEAHAYCAYVPPEYTDQRAWPVILFLHGSGERGRDGLLQTEIGIGRAIRRNRKLCPAIVVMPQCRAGKAWQGDMLEMALACVADTSREYHCDPERVYLTGLSMGGAGTWLLGSRMPNTFAALVPICGFYRSHEAPAARAELADAAAKLARLPAWCFHGTADPAVPVERSREIVAAVEAAGGKIRFDEIPAGKHNVWDGAYANPALWRWLLSQKRAEPPERGLEEPATP